MVALDVGNCRMASIAQSIVRRNTKCPEYVYNYKNAIIPFSYGTPLLVQAP